MNLFLVIDINRSILLRLTLTSLFLFYYVKEYLSIDEPIRLEQFENYFHMEITISMSQVNSSQHS